jgi:hypothetical protein
MLSFVNFRKIDRHTLESVRMLSQLRSACCVLGAGCGFCVNRAIKEAGEGGSVAAPVRQARGGAAAPARRA